MQVVGTERMRRLEAEADAAGLTYAQMMETAGRASAEALLARLPAPSGGEAAPRVLALVGPGNNGGDGLVAARYLREWGVDVTIYLWRRPADASDDNLRRARDLGIPLVRAEEDEGGARLRALAVAADAVLDALLGTGTQGPLRGGLEVLLPLVSEALARPAPRPAWEAVGALPPRPEPRAPRRALVVAVDGPSGLDFDTGEIDERALRADLSVTMAFPKPGLFASPGAEYVGELLVADIGLAREAASDVTLSVATPASLRPLLPARPPDAHKGTFGRLLIVGGSSNYVGAPALAAMAAYRVGAGLVTAAVPGSIQTAVAANAPEATYILLPHDLGAIVHDALKVLAEELKDYSALVVGPGLGRHERTGEFLGALLGGGAGRARRAVGFGARAEEAPAVHLPALPPLVIDADALNLLAERDRWWERLGALAVLTPHPGEMARLAHCEVADVQKDRLGTAQRHAQAWGVTLVLKGARTVVADASGRATIIPFANPLLATAGTGDVLAGAIGGLLAQGLPPYEAAVCGAYLHAAAGELRREEVPGDAGMVASDLLPLLPRVLARLAAT